MFVLNGRKYSQEKLIKKLKEETHFRVFTLDIF